MWLLLQVCSAQHLVLLCSKTKMCAGDWCTGSCRTVGMEGYFFLLIAQKLAVFTLTRLGFAEMHIVMQISKMCTWGWLWTLLITLLDFQGTGVKFMNQSGYLDCSFFFEFKLSSFLVVLLQLRTMVSRMIMALQYYMSWKPFWKWPISMVWCVISTKKKLLY